MSRTERKTELVRRIPVTDEQGNSHKVLEWGDFTRVMDISSMSWSEWLRCGGRLKLGDRHVNPTNDDAVFELADTGEKLTATSPR